MTKLEAYIKEVKERCDTATKGPCEVIRFDNENSYISYQVETVLSNDREHQCISWHSELTDPKAKANAEFDAHARTDVPVLLEIIATLNKYYKWEEDFEHIQEELESLVPGGGKCV